MRSKFIALSIVFHVGLAVSLLGAANKRANARRSIAVSVAEEKKKAKPAPPKPPPPKPRPAAPPPPREEPPPSETPKAAAPVAHAAPVATAIQMSNDDVGDASPGGIVIPTGRPAAAPAAKVASIGGMPSLRNHRELGPGAAIEGPCTEEASKPEPVFKAEIEYTAQARADGIEGKLKLKLTVARDGSVSNVEIMSSVAPELDAAAIATVKQWRFKPAMACGKPVDGGTYILARTFELGD